MDKKDKIKFIIGYVLLILAIAVAVVIGYFLENYPMELYLYILLVVLMLAIIFPPALFLSNLYRTVGTFKCPNCGHEFKPEKKNFSLRIHMGTSHLLTCPNCGQKSFCKKQFDGKNKRD